MSPWRFYKCGSYWESCVFFKQIEDSESQTCHSLMVLTPLYLVTSLTGLTLKRFCFGCLADFYCAEVRCCVEMQKRCIHWTVCVTEEFSLKNIRCGNNAEWFWEIRDIDVSVPRFCCRCRSPGMRRWDKRSHFSSEASERDDLFWQAFYFYFIDACCVLLALLVLIVTDLISQV